MLDIGDHGFECCVSRFHFLHHALKVPRGLFHAMHRFRVPPWSNHDFGCVQAPSFANDGSKHSDFLRDEACQLLRIALLQDLRDLRLLGVDVSIGLVDKLLQFPNASGPRRV